MYTKELVQKYTSNRDEYKETDSDLFEPLALIGVINKEILDFGCGDGRYAENLLNLGAKKVVGIDVSPDMIELANHRTKEGLSFLVADGSSLPFKDESFDVVFSNFVIHYFEDAHIPFKEIGRVLRRGGYFVGTFNIADVKVGFEHLYNTKMPIQLGKSGDIIVNNIVKSREEILSALDKAGLKILKERTLHHPSAVIHRDYEHKDKVTKKVVLIAAQKL